MKLFNKQGKTRVTGIHRKAFLMIVISSGCILALLTGCGIDVKKEAIQSDNISSQVTTNSVEQNAENIDKGNNFYQINTEEFKQDSIMIEYPQIKGLGNESIEKAINELIKNDIWNSQVEDMIKSYQEEGNTINLNVDLKYQITISTDELLSVMYTGTSYVEGGMSVNNVFHAITIDLSNGLKQSLTDFAQIDTGLAQKIKESKEITNEAVKSANNQKQSDEIRNYLINEIQCKQNEDIILELENDNADNFYVTKNSLIICISVSSAVGDYALVEIPRQ